MANQSLYTLAEGEKVLFELKASAIVKADLGGLMKFSSLTSLLGKIPGYSFITSFCCGVSTPGIFVITDKRIISAYVTKTRVSCFSKEVAKVFESYQRKALNGFCGYDRVGDGKKHCCTKSEFVFTIGVNEGFESKTYKVTTNSVETEEQAQAVVASISTIA